MRCPAIRFRRRISTPFRLNRPSSIRRPLHFRYPVRVRRLFRYPLMSSYHLVCVPFHHCCPSHVHLSICLHPSFSFRSVSEMGFLHASAGKMRLSDIVLIIDVSEGINDVSEGFNDSCSVLCFSVRFLR